MSLLAPNNSLTPAENYQIFLAPTRELLLHRYISVSAVAVSTKRLIDDASKTKSNFNASRIQRLADIPPPNQPHYVSLHRRRKVRKHNTVRTENDLLATRKNSNNRIVFRIKSITLKSHV